MNGFEFWLLIFSCIGFLFCAYSLSQDDFLFVRKNIALESVFNTLFIVLFSSLLFARIVYVIFHFKTVFLNPLGFFLFPYFPGLSLVGALIGGILIGSGICMNSKIPTTRFLDIVSLSFLCAYSIFYFPLWFSYAALIGHFKIVYLVAMIFYIDLFVVLLRVYLKYILKDGSITSLTIFLFLTMYTIFIFFDKAVNKRNFFESEGLFLLILLVGSSIYLVKVEKIHNHIPSLVAYVDRTARGLTEQIKRRIKR